MHSWQKETHHLEKIPNLHCSQWDLSSFTNSKTQHTLGVFKISGEPFDIFEWVFLRPVSDFCDKIRPCRGHLTLTLVHRGSQWFYGAFLLRPSVCLTHLCLAKNSNFSDFDDTKNPPSSLFLGINGLIFPNARTYHVGSLSARVCSIGTQYIVACQRGGVSNKPGWAPGSDKTPPFLLRQGEPGTSQYKGFISICRSVHLCVTHWHRH